MEAIATCNFSHGLHFYTNFIRENKRYYEYTDANPIFAFICVFPNVKTRLFKNGDLMMGTKAVCILKGKCKATA